MEENTMGTKEANMESIKAAQEKFGELIQSEFERIERMKADQEVTDFSRILLMYASISLFLTLFGLFGITHYAIQQRIREIGIRKIHGASFGQILWLFNRPFLYYIGIAFILIVPLVCYLMNYWLQQFAYHVHIGILHFLLPLFFTVCITLLTVCLNSYRAARNNPVDSIKYE